MRVSCIYPSRDIVGDRVGMGKLGAPSRKPYSPGYWGNEREVRYLRTRMVRTAARRCMLSMLSRCSLNPCQYACFIPKFAMLAHVVIGSPAGATTLQRWARLHARTMEDVLVPAKCVIAKSFGEK